MTRLIQGDCLEVMDRLIEEGVKVDAIITDPPYGTTACKWDNVIPFEEMWPRLKALRKDRTPIVLFGSEPFSSLLRISNLKEYKYDWIWLKNNVTGFMQAKTKPLKSLETISVFGDFSLAAQYFNSVYNPQGVEKIEGIEYSNNRKKDHITGNRNPGKTKESGKGYPKDRLEFSIDKEKQHPTQKPVALLEYLIKTYTLEGDTVLDFTMGSGTTGVACKNLNRNFIGIELDKNYFDIAKERIESTVVQDTLF